MGDSIYQFTADVVEILLDKRVNTVQTIRVETSPDLVTWTTLVTLQNNPNPPGDRWGYRNKVDFKFDPADYGLTTPFYIRFVEVSGGVDGTITGPYIIGAGGGSGGSGSTDPYVFEASGTAPNAATIAGSVKIILPSGVTRLRADNVDIGGIPLWIAFDAAGPEREIAANNGYFEFEGAFSEIYLRGEGGTCDFLLLVAVN